MFLRRSFQAKNDKIIRHPQPNVWQDRNVILPAESSTISTDVNAACFEMRKNGDESIDETATSKTSLHLK